jgi:hypothetical protein
MRPRRRRTPEAEGGVDADGSIDGHGGFHSGLMPLT